MKDDLPEAAYRLACLFQQEGKIRTHVRADETPKQGGSRVKLRAVKPGVGRGGNQGKIVTIAGRIYDSMKEACERLHIGHKTFYDMLKDGRAVRRVSPNNPKT